MATGAAPDFTPAPEPGPSADQEPVRSRKLSEEFAVILQEFEVETVTLREVMSRLHGRGYVLLLMLLSLPFCTPIPLPGVSTPFGLIIALIGGRLVFGVKPWLPARLLDTRLSPVVFRKVFAWTQKILLWFEKVLRPRMLWLSSSSVLEQLHAVPIVVCALLLLLPLPVPFSNVIPAWAVMLLAGGLLERDGVFILAGYVATVFAVAYFVAIALLGTNALDYLWNRFGFGG
jgi:hypothetical protein